MARRLLLLVGLAAAAAWFISKKKEETTPQPEPTPASPVEKEIKPQPGAVEVPTPKPVQAPEPKQEGIIWAGGASPSVFDERIGGPALALALAPVIGPIAPIITPIAEAISKLLPSPEKEPSAEESGTVTLVSGTDAGSLNALNRVRPALKNVGMRVETMSASEFAANVRVARELSMSARKVNYLVLGGWLTPGFDAGNLRKLLLDAAPNAQSIVRNEGDTFVQRVNLGARVPVIWAFGWTAKDTVNAGLQAVKQFFGQVGTPEPISGPTPEQRLAELEKSRREQREREAREAAERAELTRHLNELETRKQAQQQAAQFVPVLFGPETTSEGLRVSKAFKQNLSKTAGHSSLLQEIMSREALFNQYGGVPYKSHGFTRQLYDVYQLTPTGLAFVGREEA